MTAPENPQGAALLNQLEKARDASHNQALSPGEWRTTIEDAGLRVQHVEVTGEEIPFPRWLSPVPAGGPEAERAEILALSALAEIAGLVVRRGSDGMLHVLKHRTVVVAVKP